MTISRLINAFFRWEFNSCETLIKDGEVHPIDYANACPDVSLISLHYYFPWAIKALLRWSVFCCVTGRTMHVGMNPEDWYAVGDSEQAYAGKLEAYRRLADEYFEIEDYEEFCDAHLGHIDEAMADYVDSAEFDQLLVETVSRAFPPREHEQFVAHYRGLLGAWVGDQR